MNFYTIYLIYLYIMLSGQYASIIIGQRNLVILQIVKMSQEQEQKHTLQWKYNAAVFFFFFSWQQNYFAGKIIMPSYIIQ